MTNPVEAKGRRDAGLTVPFARVPGGKLYATGTAVLIGKVCPNTLNCLHEDSHHIPAAEGSLYPQTTQCHIGPCGPVFQADQKGWLFARFLHCPSSAAGGFGSQIASRPIGVKKRIANQFLPGFAAFAAIVPGGWVFDNESPAVYGEALGDARESSEAVSFAGGKSDALHGRKEFPARIPISPLPMVAAADS